MMEQPFIAKHNCNNKTFSFIPSFTFWIFRFAHPFSQIVLETLPGHVRLSPVNIPRSVQALKIIFRLIKVDRMAAYLSFIEFVLSGVSTGIVEL